MDNNTIIIDMIEEPTLLHTVIDVMEAARLPREAITCIRVLDWDGPGGGNPEVELTFSSREYAERFVWITSGAAFE